MLDGVEIDAAMASPGADLRSHKFISPGGLDVLYHHIMPCENSWRVISPRSRNLIRRRGWRQCRFRGDERAALRGKMRDIRAFWKRKATYRR